MVLKSGTTSRRERYAYKLRGSENYRAFTINPVTAADCDPFCTNMNEEFFITVQSSVSHDLQGDLSHYPSAIMALKSILTIPETLPGAK